MVNENFKLIRTDSLCPSPEELLLKYVKENDIYNIRNLIFGTGKELLSHIYDNPYNRPILHIACLNFKDWIEESTIFTLVDLGADLSFSLESDNYKQALHFAAESTCPHILRALINCLKRNSKETINNVDGNCNTALHILFKQGDQESPDFLKCAEILLDSGIDVNKGDVKNQTVVLLAAKNGRRDLVKLLLDQENIDLDSHKLRGKTAREWIEANHLYDFNLPEENRNNNQGGKEAIFATLKEDRIEDFRSLPIAEFVDADDGSNTLLQLACKKGHTKAVQYLLSNHADPNHTCVLNPKTPLEIISEYGYYDIFDLLLVNPNIKISEKVISNLLKYMNSEKFENVDYDKCFQLLKKKLQNSDLNLNHKDINGNTPLHYAVLYAEPDKILDLLSFGASLATKNKYNVLPIHDIDANVLEKHLDGCIDIHVHPNKELLTVAFNYRTLMPPQEGRKDTGKDVEENFVKTASDINSETDVISYMGKSSELKYLLTHPLISSFLYVKWLRVCWFFYVNLIFYFTFSLSLILYVLLFYNNNSESNYTLSTFLLTVLCITLIILLLRELFQMFVSPKTYFLSMENWVELCLICVTFSIILEKSHADDVRKQLAAFAVLLSTFEFVLLVGQHPKICTNVVILRTVSFNFFKFLCWFFILIVAFGFSFYVLFNKTDGDSANDDEEQDFFADPGMSMIKTIVMLTGEFDASSINFQTFPLASRIIFLLFVFMITIILFNLLNGLAVSDTTSIKNDAELVSLVARIEHITYIENMVLGNLLPTTLLKLMNNFCCCLPCNANNNFKIPKLITEKVCLFPHFLQNYCLKFYPNKSGEVILENDKKHSFFSKIHLTKKTVRRTLEILQERKRKKEEINLEALVKNLQKSVEENKKGILFCLEELRHSRQTKG